MILTTQVLFIQGTVNTFMPSLRELEGHILETHAIKILPDLYWKSMGEPFRTMHCRRGNPLQVQQYLGALSRLHQPPTPLWACVMIWKHTSPLREAIVLLWNNIYNTARKRICGLATNKVQQPWNDG
jgi:hypothetical protein